MIEDKILALWATGLTQAEIGRKLGLPKWGVNAAIARARKRGDPRAVARSRAGLRFGVGAAARQRNQAFVQHQGVRARARTMLADQARQLLREAQAAVAHATTEAERAQAMEKMWEIRTQYQICFTPDGGIAPELNRRTGRVWSLAPPKQTATSKVRARLTKVLRLARGAGTEGERAAALAAAKRIQAEYGIS